MELPALITLVAIAEYMVMIFLVGMRRQRYGVEAPAIAGNPEWERMFRVQQNTLEQLVIFIPALWIFASFIGPELAAAVGSIFLIARPLYWRSYVRDPSGRALPFILGMFANFVLVLGSLYGILRGGL